MTEEDVRKELTRVKEAMQWWVERYEKLKEENIKLRDRVEELERKPL